MNRVERMDTDTFRRRLVASSFPEYPDLGSAMNDLRFVQADPIRSPARAQDLILRQRVSGYRAGDLEEAFPNLNLEEGYLFAYGFMLPAIWRTLWKEENKGLGKLHLRVMELAKAGGEIHPRQLAEHLGKQSVTNYWGGKSQASKRALEDLADMGFLRVSRREKGVRVYEAVREDGLRYSDPGERYRTLLTTTCHIFGPVSKPFLLAELKSHRGLAPSLSDRNKRLEELLENGELQELDVDGVVYLWSPEKWLEEEIADRARILAPFDPLVRDRNRFEQVWGWPYRFEAYVPAAKRERGYYAMPLLWRDEVVGWVNANVESGRLMARVGFQTQRPSSCNFAQCLGEEFESLTRFLDLECGACEVRFDT